MLGVSVVTCTNKPKYLNNLMENFTRQKYPIKELIVCVNTTKINLAGWKKKWRHIPHVKIYQMDERYSLGHCLNDAIRKAQHPVIAKFDDDDYYSPEYLITAVHDMQKNNADLVGKRTTLTYLEKKGLLVLRFPNHENKFVSLVAGGTLLFRKKVFQAVKFANISLGEDVRFISICRRRGFKIYSNERYHYVYMRHTDPKDHTWNASDQYILGTSRIVANTKNYQSYANPAKGK